MCIKRLASSGLSWLWVAVIMIAVDQVTKTWVVEHLVPFQPHVVTSFFNLTLAYNTGAAFSFLHSASGWQNWLLGGLAVVVAMFIITWLARLPRSQYWQCVALSLILAGALGNAWDRMLYGHVIDFVNFHVGDWHF